MNSEVKERWVSALRSGEYSQAIETLRNRNGHCCLGVLCEVVGVEWQENVAIYNGVEGHGILPANLAEELGLSVSQQHRLTARNDGKEFFEKGMYENPIEDFRDKPQDFQQIADFIEQEL